MVETKKERWVTNITLLHYINLLTLGVLSDVLHPSSTKLLTIFFFYKLPQILHVHRNRIFYLMNFMAVARQKPSFSILTSCESVTFICLKKIAGI